MFSSSFNLHFEKIMQVFDVAKPTLNDDAEEIPLILLLILFCWVVFGDFFCF